MRLGQGVDTGSLERDPVLAEIVRRLRQAIAPDLIYLFGSRARGDADADSDYDLMVVVADSAMPRHLRERAAFRALCGVGVPKDVIVLTQREFQARRGVVTSLPATVEREGALLYAS